MTGKRASLPDLVNSEGVQAISAIQDAKETTKRAGNVEEDDA